MRKFIFLSLFLLAGSVFLCSEEAVENDNEQPQSFLVPLSSQIILFGAGEYSFSDGSRISYRELKQNLSLIPENKKIIRRADAWNIACYSFFVASMGFVIYGLIDGNERTATNMGFLGFGMLASGLGSQQLFNLELNKAINNYNLTVMGVPVRYR